MNKKVIVASFFDVYPVTFGSSIVISSFFESLPFKNKKLYQISKEKNKVFNKKIKTIHQIYDSKFLKLFSVVILIKDIFFDLSSSKTKNLLFIEGASWIGFSFLLVLILKIFKINVKIIYRAHGIEYEIRKKNSNFFISKLSFIFEKYVYKNSDISTSVSKIEKQKIKKLYNIETQIFPNIINFFNFKRSNKEFKKKYILYSGSYKYLPNKKAIDRLYFDIMPKLLKKNPHIIFVLTGSGKIPHKSSWFKNLGLVSKKRYLNILKNSLCLVVPTREGYGTRVKIIEALCCGTVVVSSKIGIEGISFIKKNPPPFKCTNDNSFIKVICRLAKNKIYKKLAEKSKSYYINNYSAQKKTLSFVKENL